ncbi:50S ribosomal protein L5 [Bacilli bacterium]|nr:50S ribosomal protein L5 [Bacilli bacterium]
MSLKQEYTKIIQDTLMEKFHYKSVMQVPRLEKIVINYGCGDAAKEAKLLDAAINEITNISGQKPVTTKSKNAIASFKIRENQPIGVMVTLRGERMWNFVRNLINVAIPRVRDFKGVSSKLDGHGNYTLGIKEQIIFTEVVYDDVKKIRGFNISFITSTENDEEAKEMLLAIGMPMAIKKR